MYPRTMRPSLNVPSGDFGWIARPLDDASRLSHPFVTEWDKCNVSPSPTDVSPTENSWMLHPLDKVSLDYFAPDRTILSLNSDLIGVLCVGRACIRRRGANPINLIRGVCEADQTSHWSIRCRRPTEATIAADGASFMLDAVQGRDTSVRGTVSKGRFVQGVQCYLALALDEACLGWALPWTSPPLDEASLWWWVP